VDADEAAHIPTSSARQRSNPGRGPLVGDDAQGPAAAEAGSSTLADLAEGSFQPCWTTRARQEQVRRLVLCSGKIYYDLAGTSSATALARRVALIEQLYPFPGRAEGALVASSRGWSSRLGAGGAPNMGAVARARHRLEENLPERHAPLRRPPLACEPEPGLPTAHLREQDRIVREALA